MQLPLFHPVFHIYCTVDYCAKYYHLYDQDIHPIYHIEFNTELVAGVISWLNAVQCTAILDTLFWCAVIALMMKESIQEILVAVDGSAASKKAAADAIQLAKMANADLVFMHVIEDIKMGGVIGARTKYGDIKLVEGYNRARKEAALHWMRTFEELAKSEKVKAKSEILYDTGKSVTGTIVHYAQKNNVDLVVVGSRGLSKFRRLLVGSVASGVFNHAHCPVLVAR